MAEIRFKWRIAALSGVVLLVFSAIGTRLVLLHLRPAAWVVEPIQQARTFESKPAASRGRIVDRTGRILAMDTPSYHVCIDPKWISANGAPRAVSRYLAAEFHLSEAGLDEELARTHRQYTQVKKYVSGNQIKRFKRMNLGVMYTPPELVGGTETNIYLKGVWFEEAPIRKYPNGPLMAHVVGFSNLAGEGSAGVEQVMNEYLRGTEGLRRGQVDGSGHEIYRTRELDIPPEDGATVELTLDSWLQYQVEKVVEKTCRDFNAKAVWAIVQHVRTGEILAMASFPTYDPNEYSKAPEEWRRNRAISFNYEPGSTMKAALISAALDNGVVTESDEFDCEKGYWVYGGKALRDSHGEGVIPVSDIVKVSSNIGTAKIALEMGNQLVYDSLRKFHFGDRLGVGLPGEEGGIFYSPRHWSKISITRIGMGHEIGVTALQVLSMMNAIAYNGVQMKPYIIKRVVAPDGTELEQSQPQELGRPLSPSAARRMQHLLARVVMDDEGTGTKARVEGYTVAGKTGTAQKIRPKEEGGGYYPKNFVCSFAGFLPVENPEIGIIVVADDPGEYNESGRKIGYYGGTVCGPAFSEIAKVAVEYLRIAPGGNRIYVVRPDE
jgi:cell division protein FtsI/penicillin-binding protein 2